MKWKKMESRLSPFPEKTRRSKIECFHWRPEGKTGKKWLKVYDGKNITSNLFQSRF